MMEWLSNKALMSAIKKVQRSGQALYASCLMKKIIAADTIIEVFDRYNIDFSVKPCRAGPDAHKMVLVQFHHGRNSWMYLRISRISFTICANASQLLVKDCHTHTKRIPCLVGSGNSKIIIFHAVSFDKVLRNQIEMGV